MPISRFIGCVAVTTSMKALTFDTRSAIAKECINRVRFTMEIMNKMRFTKAKDNEYAKIRFVELLACGRTEAGQPTVKFR